MKKTVKHFRCFGYTGADKNFGVFIATPIEQVEKITELTVINIRDAKGTTKEVLAGEVTIQTETIKYN